MRITNTMMSGQFLSDANDSLNRVSKYHGQVSSTKRISHISDDPQATITALRARNKLSNLNMYQNNIDTAKSYLSESESSASELNEILQTVYEEIVDASGSGKNKDDFSVIANELAHLQKEIVSIGNATVGTSYLFGGFNFTGTTDAGGAAVAPFSVDDVTGHLVYNGIDLTQISCAEDYDHYISLMSDCTKTIQDDDTELAATSSDAYAKNTVCTESLDALKKLLYNGKSALSAAEKFGIDASNSTGYKQLSGFVDALSNLSSEFSNEC